MKILYDYLKLTGTTQQQLADRMEMDLPALNGLLRGRRKAGLSTLERLHKATGISMQILIDGVENDRFKQQPADTLESPR